MADDLSRALELTGLSMRWAQTPQARKENPGATCELSRLREVLCDYYFGENEYHSADAAMQRYFDQFALIVRR